MVQCPHAKHNIKGFIFKDVHVAGIQPVNFFQLRCVLLQFFHLRDMFFG